MKLYAAIALSCAVSCLLCSCGKSEKERAEEAGRFTTSTKPAPHPQRENVEALVRQDRSAPTTLGGAPKFELYSEYKGEDMRQVTGVSGRSLLLCFTAPWCPYSAEMRRALKKLASQEQSRIQVVEINADAYPAVAEQFGIDKVPTTIFYTEGVKLRTLEGSYSAADVRKFLHNLLTRKGG